MEKNNKIIKYNDKYIQITANNETFYKIKEDIN